VTDPAVLIGDGDKFGVERLGREGVGEDGEAGTGFLDGGWTGILRFVVEVKGLGLVSSLSFPLIDLSFALASRITC
jgi:hypothetical protein